MDCRDCPFFSRDVGCTASQYERSIGCKKSDEEIDKEWDQWFDVYLGGF